MNNPSKNPFNNATTLSYNDPNIYHSINQETVSQNISLPNAINNPNNAVPQKPQSKDNQRFNIILRIRPQVENDTVELKTQDDLKQCIFKQNQNQVLLKNEKTDNDYEMTYDYVFGEESTQSDLYNTFGTKMVGDVLKGFNSTIMAYGQTGSGKSYTMFGKNFLDEEEEDNYNSNVEQDGLVQRAIKEIFEYKEAYRGKRHISVTVNFMQIYLNQIVDLLDKNREVEFKKNNKNNFKTTTKENKNLTIENSLKVVHDKDGKLIVQNLITKEADDAQKLLLEIEEGASARITAETIMNKTSSRSHAVLKITIRQRWIERIKDQKGDIVDNLHNLKGILTFVDLAGSESVSRTGSEGINQDEAKEINKSISALGRVIETLARQNKFIDTSYLNERNDTTIKNTKTINKSPQKNNYVSYRDSKLTEILSDCLGGNSKTYIVACISPFAANCEETYSTLQFASRAMIIRTQAKKNEKIANVTKGPKNNNNNNNTINTNTNNIQQVYLPSENIGKKDTYVLTNNNSGYEKSNGNFRHKINNKSTRETANFGLNKYKPYMSNRDDENRKEDYQAITKKFYSVIVHLQDELGKLIVHNYSLEQENNYLKEQLKNIS